MNTQRFIVQIKDGFDFGVASKLLETVGGFDDFDSAKATRDEFNSTGNGAQYRYAEIIDRQDERAVIGFGHYGDGSRIMSIRSIMAVCKTDDVLFTGTLADCEAFKKV